MKTIYRIIIISLILAFLNPKIVKGQCEPQDLCFLPGEELYYDIVYNWGFIWVDAGRVEFKVKKEWLHGHEVYHFSGIGTSLKKHDWLFKVRDYYHSWAFINNLKPINYSRNTSEGDYQVRNFYEFDYQQNKIYTNTWNSKKAKTFDTLQMVPCLFDIMTAVYYARTFDFKNFSLNQKIPITMIVDNEIYNLYGRYLGKETIKMRDTKKKVECLKFSMLLVEGTMFKGGEDLFVWVSNDANKVPILVEAKILVGSVKAQFKSAVNLKYQADYNSP